MHILVGSIGRALKSGQSGKAQGGLRTLHVLRTERFRAVVLGPLQNRLGHVPDRSSLDTPRQKRSQLSETQTHPVATAHASEKARALQWP